MTAHIHRWLMGAAMLGLMFSVPATADATNYTFTTIADTNGPFTSLSPASINAGGTVVFGAPLKTGGEGIFTGSGGPVITIADTSGTFSSFPFVPAINSAGTVAFHASLDTGGQGIFTSSGGALTAIADTSGAFSGFGFPPSINTGGTVAFLAGLKSGGLGIFTGSGGPITTITSGVFSDFQFGTINTGGTVAFAVGTSGGAQGVFTGNGGPLTTIADTSGAFIDLDFIPSINANGTVAFVAGLKTGGQRIFTGTGVLSNTTSTIADTSGAFSGFGSFAPPWINANGTVAFGAALKAGGVGIFTGPDPVENKVIATGDPLLGSTVSFLNFFRGLNDSESLAFRAILANGTQGIFRADPVPAAAVPEPASLLLLGVGLASLLGFRKFKLG